MPRKRTEASYLYAAAALAAACAAVAPEVNVPSSPGPDLVAVSRAMARVDLGAPPEAPAAGAESKEAVDRFLALYALARDEQAWGAFRALADAHPKLPWGSLGMARIYIAWGTLDQAKAELQRARAADSANWIAVLLGGAVEERGGRIPEAQADYLEVLRVDPENPLARLGLARMLFQAGDFGGAYREAKRSLDALPGQTAALSLLGRTAAALGKKDEAVGYFSLAASAAPRDPAPLADLAGARLAAGDAKGAVAAWKEAVSLEETLAYLKGLAAAAAQAEDLEAGSYAAQGIARLDPATAANWRRLADLRLLQRDKEGAEAALRIAVERDPLDVQSRVTLGRLLLDRGQPLLAMAQFRAAGDAAHGERTDLERRLQVFPISRADPARIQRVVADRLDRVAVDAASVPRPSGALVLRVTVGPGGEATEVAVVEDATHDEWVRASAYWNLKNASYPDKAERLTFRFAIGASKVAKATKR
jgi:tetratricopeptide (TPR) repeat protein